LIVPDCRKTALQGIIRGRVTLDRVIYSDGLQGYNGLVDIGYGKRLESIRARMSALEVKPI
jgi:hypothetical protein